MNYHFMHDIKYIETVHFARKNVFSNVILKNQSYNQRHCHVCFIGMDFESLILK